jgi:hypothetical protein
LPCPSTRQPPRARGARLGVAGSIEAPDEKTAVAKAAKLFNIAPARQNKIVVIKLDPKKREAKREPRNNT